MNSLYHRFDEDLKLCNRSDGTRAQYRRQLERLASYCEGLATEPSRLSDEDLRYYLLHHVPSGGSAAGLKMSIAALKFLYETTLRQPAGCFACSPRRSWS